MLTDFEQGILKKALKRNEGRLRYYLILAVVLIVFSWFLFLAFQRSGALVLAVVVSLAIWYYPWRYYKKIKLIRQDLARGEKLELSTVVYGKHISKINRLEPYYYIYTEEEDFEVDKFVYNNLSEDAKIRVVYAAHSKIILELKVVES